MTALIRAIAAALVGSLAPILGLWCWIKADGTTAIVVAAGIVYVACAIAPDYASLQAAERERTPR